MAPKQHPRPWEPCTIPVSDKAEALVLDAVEAQIEARFEIKALDGKKARRNKGDRLRKEIITVGALVLDVLAHHLTKSSDPFIIHLNHKWLSAGPDEIVARNRSVTEKLEALEWCGWLKRDTIIIDENFLTELHVGDVLIREAKKRGVSLSDIGVSQGPPEVELKGEKTTGDFPSRPLLSYTPTDETDRIYDELVKLSNYISEARIEGAATGDVLIDTRRRRLTRSFLDGSFNKGGRLGGPAFWLNLPREIRRSALMIDGEPLAEVDVRAMMPSIAYALNGAVPDGDPYTLNDYPDIPRAASKKAMMQLLWKPLKPTSRLNEEARKEIPGNYKSGEVFQFIKDRNAPIAELLGRPEPIGASLMWHESEIIIEASLRCFEEGFTALPLHDALLTSCSAAGRAEEILGEAFKDRLGVSPTVKVDLFDTPALETAA